MAYHSDVSGTYEVYLERFPSLGDRQQLSNSGGRWPAWSADGERLFYTSFDGRQIFEVPISIRDEVSIGTPRRLFERSDVPDPRFPSYDVMPDGKRFVVLKQARDTAARMNIVVVQNWFEELKRRVPVSTQ